MPMLIAVLSDSHSNYANIDRALDQLRGSGIERMLHCGDIADPAAAALFAEFPTSFVLGNVDSDPRGLREAIESSGNQYCGRFGELELDGRRIAMLHGDNSRALRDAEQSGQYDLVVY